MLKKNYMNIRSSMHTFSKAPLAEGQQNYDQATARSGHNTYASDIRAQEIPAIANLAERDSKYLVTNNQVREVGGELGQAYVDVIKFIEAGTLQEIPNSNGEAYTVIDASSSPLTGWIDPSDKPLTQTALSDGYEIRLFSDGREVVRNYGWTFDAFNGILHFSKKFRPGSEDWLNAGFTSTPTIQGFIYIGKTTSDFNSSLEESFNETKESVNTALGKTLAVAPFKFSDKLMQKLGAPYQVDYTAEEYDANTWFQTLSFIIPGFVFQLTALDTNETVITEMRHLKNGDTQILLDLPWDINYDQPIVRYAYDSGEPGIGTKYPVLGHYAFIAVAFVSSDGSKIPVNMMLDYDLQPHLVIPHHEDVYTYPEDPVFQSPYPVGTYIGH